jgi:hypothetical protein
MHVTPRHKKKAKTVVDPFDPDQLRLPPELMATMNAPEAVKAKPKRVTRVQFTIMTHEAVTRPVFSFRVSKHHNVHALNAGAGW